MFCENQPHGSRTETKVVLDYREARMSVLTGFTHLPPKSCIPSRANTTMKRKRRKSRLMMDFMELMRDTTRFLREAQYLKERNHRLFAFLNRAL